MSDTKRNIATDNELSDTTSADHEKSTSHHRSAFNKDFQPEGNAEVFLNLYAFKPSTVPPFALTFDSENKNGTNTQKRFNQKRHEKQKEKNMKSQGSRSSSSSSINDAENADIDSVNSGANIDQISHWNNFMGNLNYIRASGLTGLSDELKSNSVKYKESSDTITRQRRNSFVKGESTSSSLDSTSDVNFDDHIVLKPEDDRYNNLLPNLEERWRGSDRMKIIESIPNVDNIGFKNQQEKNQFNNYVNELKACFYEDKNYNGDWDYEKMEEEKNNVLNKNELKELDIQSMANYASHNNSMEIMSSRTSLNGNPKYGNMEPRNLEKAYQRPSGTPYRNGSKLDHYGSKNYHLSMLQKKDNIAAFFKQQYGRKKTELLPRIEKILFQNRYVPLLCRFIIVVLCTVALSLSARIYINSKAHYFGRDLNEPITADLKQYTMGQQPSTIMAIVINVISIVFEVYVAVDEFKGEPLGVRNPLGKLRLLLLDLFFIIFFSANLAIAFGSMFDDDWVCMGGFPSSKSSPKTNYICRKQRTLSSFLFLILCAWVITFTISITRVVNRVTASQR